MSLSTQFKVNPIIVCKWTETSQLEATKWQEFRGTWPKVNQAKRACSEFAHQIWAESDQQFVCECTETVQPIRGQETAEIQQRVTRS